MKNLYKNISIVIASFTLLLQATTVSAALIELEFDYNDTVTVGDTFEVNILSDIPLNLDLTSIGFDVLSLNNGVSLSGAAFPIWMMEDLIFDTNDVNGFVDIFDLPESGDNTLLATLTFTADSIGNDTVSLLGDFFNFGGAFFVDTADNFAPVIFDIDSAFDINVVAKEVPAPATLSLFAIGLFAVLRTRKQS